MASPIYDQMNPNWLTLHDALRYTGASRNVLTSRAREGRVLRRGKTQAVRYWKPSLEAMRKAFGGSRHG